MKYNEALRAKFDKPKQLKTDAAPAETEQLAEGGAAPEEGVPGVEDTGGKLVPTTSRRRQGFAGFRAGMLVISLSLSALSVYLCVSVCPSVSLCLSLSGALCLSLCVTVCACECRIC